VTNSSWHGTHVAGTIGAASNNGVGVTGINWVSKILPVRVLGKCGGYTSDIIDGMRWAAGLSVTGVPANSHPARAINISLGGSGACSAEQQTAINEIVAAGTVVVVAAGNSNTDASNFNPANCNNVITVAATNRSGYRSYYTNYGSVVEISAPGGDTSSSDSNGVLSTLNTGTQGPVADTYAYYQGTSMATPHVTGVASLVLSVKPSLTPAQVLQVLQSTARAFPVGSTCNTSICGAGIVDAAAAVHAVSTNVGLVKSVIGGNFAPGDPITFTLNIANTGSIAATSVIVTDVVPSQVLNPTFASSLMITQTGLLSYVWNIGTLGAGQSGVITLYGQIDPGLASDFSFTNLATISDPQDNTPSNNSSSVTIGERKVLSCPQG
jgi:serine protease